MAASAAVALAALAHTWFRWAGWNAADYYQFWCGGQAAGAAPAAELWSEEGHRRLGAACFVASFVPGTSSSRKMAAFTREVLEDGKTPALYVFFALLSSGDYDRDYAIFRFLSLCAFAAAVLVLGRMFGWQPEAALLFLAAVMLFAAPFASDAGPANVNQLQVGGLALVIVLLLRGRDAAAGAVLGVLTVFKPNLAPAAVLLWAARLLQGDMRGAARLAAGGAAAAAAAVAGSSLYLRDARSWLYWWEARGHLPEYPVFAGNLSPAQWLWEHGIQATGVITALVLAGALAALWAGRRARNDVAVLGIGCAAMTLGSTLSWMHYYLLLLPFVMYLLRPAAGWRRQALAAAAAVALGAPTAFSQFAITVGLAAAGALGVAILCAFSGQAPDTDRTSRSSPSS